MKMGRNLPVGLAGMTGSMKRLKTGLELVRIVLEVPETDVQFAASVHLDVSSVDSGV